MKVAIGMPIAEDVPGECFGHHLNTIVEAVKYVHKLSSDSEVFSFTPVGLCPHDYGRVEITEQAIKRGCDRLFFMDDDTVTPSGGFTKLMKVMDERKAVAVSGYYLRRGNPYTPVWAVEKDGTWFNVMADGGVHDIHVSGLGCCLLDLEWITKNLPKPWFKMDQSDRCTIITDDVVLFRGIRAAGGLILGDASVQCPHIGRREFICSETAGKLREVHSILEETGKVQKAKVEG